MAAAQSALSFVPHLHGSDVFLFLRWEQGGREGEWGRLSYGMVMERFWKTVPVEESGKILGLHCLHTGTDKC